MCDCVVNFITDITQYSDTYFFCKEKGRVPVCAIPNREKGVAHQTEELTTVKKIDLVCYYIRTSAAYITISL